MIRGKLRGEKAIRSINRAMTVVAHRQAGGNMPEHAKHVAYAKGKAACAHSRGLVRKAIAEQLCNPEAISNLDVTSSCRRFL